MDVLNPQLDSTVFVSQKIETEKFPAELNGANVVHEWLLTGDSPVNALLKESLLPESPYRLKVKLKGPLGGKDFLDVSFIGTFKFQKGDRVFLVAVGTESGTSARPQEPRSGSIPGMLHDTSAADDLVMEIEALRVATTPEEYATADARIEQIMGYEAPRTQPELDFVIRIVNILISKMKIIQPVKNYNAFHRDIRFAANEDLLKERSRLILRHIKIVDTHVLRLWLSGQKPDKPFLRKPKPEEIPFLEDAFDAMVAGATLAANKAIVGDRSAMGWGMQWTEHLVELADKMELGGVNAHGDWNLKAKRTGGVPAMAAGGPGQGDNLQSDITDALTKNEFSIERHRRLYGYRNSLIHTEFVSFPYDDEAFLPGNLLVWEQTRKDLTKLIHVLTRLNYLARMHFQPSLFLLPMKSRERPLKPRGMGTLLSALASHAGMGVQLGNKLVQHVEGHGREISIRIGNFYNDWGGFSNTLMVLTFSEDQSHIVEVGLRREYQHTTALVAAPVKIWDAAIRLDEDGPKLLVIVNDEDVNDVKTVLKKDVPLDVVGLSQVQEEWQKYESLFDFQGAPTEPTATDNPSTVGPAPASQGSDSKITGRATGRWISWLYELGKKYKGWTDRYIDESVAPKWEAVIFQDLFVLLPTTIIFFVTLYQLDARPIDYETSSTVYVFNRFLASFSGLLTAIGTVLISGYLFGSRFTHPQVREYPMAETSKTVTRSPTASERWMLRYRGFAYGGWAAGLWFVVISGAMFVLPVSFHIWHSVLAGGVALLAGWLVASVFHQYDNNDVIHRTGGIVGTAGGLGDESSQEITLQAAHIYELKPVTMPTRREFLRAAPTVGAALFAASASAQTGDVAGEARLAITQLETSDAKVRQVARNRLIELSRKYDYKGSNGTGFAYVIPEMNVAFSNAGRGERHLRSGILKVMTVLNSARAQRLAKDLIGDTPYATIFNTALTYSRTVLFAEQRTQPERDQVTNSAEVSFNHWTNLAGKFPVSDKNLKEASSSAADLLFTVQKLSELALEQKRRPSDPKALAQKTQQIIQETEYEKSGAALLVLGNVNLGTGIVAIIADIASGILRHLFGARQADAGEKSNFGNVEIRSDISQAEQELTRANTALARAQVDEVHASDAQKMVAQAKVIRAQIWVSRAQQNLRHLEGELKNSSRPTGQSIDSLPGRHPEESAA